jgi:hypothetical protein
MAGKRPNGEGSIYSYKGRWYVQGVIGGKRRKVGRATQAAARTAWEELKKESERGARTPSGYKNVAELLDRFYAFKEPVCRLPHPGRLPERHRPAPQAQTGQAPDHGT